MQSYNKCKRKRSSYPAHWDKLPRLYHRPRNSTISIEMCSICGELYGSTSTTNRLRFPVFLNCICRPQCHCCFNCFLMTYIKAIKIELPVDYERDPWIFTATANKLTCLHNAEFYKIQDNRRVSTTTRMKAKVHYPSEKEVQNLQAITNSYNELFNACDVKLDMKPEQMEPALSLIYRISEVLFTRLATSPKTAIIPVNFMKPFYSGFINDNCTHIKLRRFLNAALECESQWWCALLLLWFLERIKNYNNFNVELICSVLPLCFCHHTESRDDKKTCLLSTTTTKCTSV